MTNLLAQCTWPDLPPKYDRALRQAVAFILGHFNVSGIVASGTIIRGNPDPTSDLDLYVIQQEPFRQRVQRFFNGIPAEIFVNPPAAIESYFKEEYASRRPLTAHMLATGFVVLQVDPIVNTLRDQAAQWLAKAPEDTPESMTMARYMVATLYEDALDVVERDPVTAQMLLSRAVMEMLQFGFTQAGRFWPRHKELLAAYGQLDAETAGLATRFFETAALDTRVRLAEQIAERTIGVSGFFEWETFPEKVAGGAAE
ncbi:MAG: hypothetical protein JXM69_12115 [Anaerolineae bacterium]|nr:hypothetical protein [Anaerolineae bacterium]